MLLSEIVKELERELSGRGAYTLKVLTRQRLESGEQWGDTESFSVTDVVLDEHDSHIDILTDQGAEHPSHPATAMTTESLFQRLRPLEARCGAWSVYVGSVPESIDGEWVVRVDAPIVGIATNHEERAVALLPFPPEQWSNAV